MVTDNFIRVYNAFFNSIEEQSEKYLTSDELLTYLLLDNEIDMYRKGGTYSYEYILENMKKKNSKENRENFIKSVKSLEEKGVVKIQKEGKTYIKLEINHDDIELSEQYSFEKLSISEFRRLYDSTKMKVEEIHIYLLIKSESRMDKRAFLSYSLIAKKLNVSRSTAQRLIKAMLKKGSIKMEESKNRKEGSVEFENNEYFCNLQATEEMMGIQEEEKKKDLKAKEKKKAEIRTFKVGQFNKPKEENERKIEEMF